MPLTAADLLSKFQQKDETFRIPISDDRDEDLVVKLISDVRDMSRINRRAADLMKMKPAPAWKPYLPITKEVATIVAEVTGLVVTPKFTDLQALQLCKESGPFAAWLHVQIMNKMQETIPAFEMEAIDSLKNDLEPTSSDEST